MAGKSAAMLDKEREDTIFMPIYILIVFSRCIQIRGLHKVYDTKKARCCAVNSLQLTLYENQILALLGTFHYILNN